LLHFAQSIDILLDCWIGWFVVDKSFSDKLADFFGESLMAEEHVESLLGLLVGHSVAFGVLLEEEAEEFSYFSEVVGLGVEIGLIFVGYKLHA
jgi:hypothetical protein